MVEQPNFDDERTILSARPVVPLEQIDAKVRHRRRWFLGGAFAVAMLLGAASALVSAYFKLRNVPDPEIQSSSMSSSLPEQTLGSLLPSLEEQPTVEPVTVTPKRLKPTFRNTDHRDEPVTQPRLSEEEELRRIRDAVLVDEWQERRLRRAERRERRRAERSERDLSNLDEIFEGRRRP
jgi:hypothetical protein